MPVYRSPWPHGPPAGLRRKRAIRWV